MAISKPEIGKFNWGVTLNQTLDELDSKKLDVTVASATYQPARVVGSATYPSLAAALASAPAGTVIVVPTSISTGAVTIPADVTVKADGNVTLTLTGPVTMSDRSRLLGFVLAVPIGSGGVTFGTSTDASVGNCKVLGTSATNGFVTGAAVRPTLSYCSTDGCYYGVLLNSGCADALVVGGTHTNSKANSSFEASFYVPNAVRSRIVGVTVSGSAGHGFYDAGTDNTFTACVAQNNGTPGNNDHRGAYLDGPVRSSWIGCEFLSNIECGLYERNTTVGTTVTGCKAVGNNTGGRPGGNGFEMLGADYTVTGCYAAGQLPGSAPSAGAGFYLAGAGVCTGCRAVGNALHGFYLYDTTHVVLSAWEAKNNGSVGGATPGDGVSLNGSSAGSSLGAVVSGGTAFDTQATKTQRYGIGISANVNNYVVTGNIVRTAENLTGGISDGGGANKVVANNLVA